MLLLSYQLPVIIFLPRCFGIYQPFADFQARYSNQGEAINLATRSFTPQEGVGRAIIVITDGENHEGGAVEAAKAAAEKGIQVSVLGVGMPEGAPIPIEGTNDYRRDREGNVIVTRLNEAMCQEIAKDGKGIYVRVDNSNSAQKLLTRKLVRWLSLM